MNSAIEIKSIKNLTTQVEVLKKQGDFVEASEYSSQSLSVEIKGGPLPLEQLVSISGRIRLNSQYHPFEVIGKISATMPLIPDSTKLEIHLNQYDKKLWQQFLQHKAEAQNQVDNLFKKVKGAA